MAAVAFVAAVMTFAVGLAALTIPGSPREADSERVTTGPGPPRSTIQVLAADQSMVSGTVSKVMGTKVEAPALAVPLTLNVARGGGTKAEFSGGTVAGKKVTVTWDGGRGAMPLTGQGSIDLNGPVDVELTSKGATYALDGQSRLLTPGSYVFGVTVAVIPANGTLGAPKDGARLEVPDGVAASLLTRDGVRVTQAPAPLQLKGPGQLVLEGALQVTTRDGMRQATKITFGPGAFELNLEPEAGGYRIDRALLQGPMTVEG